MKPSWLAQSQDSAELEALQTDVMRFIAILGLCLAAIFSLVQSAAMEQASVKTQTSPDPAPALKAPVPPAPRPSAEPPPPSAETPRPIQVKPAPVVVPVRETATVAEVTDAPEPIEPEKPEEQADPPPAQPSPEGFSLEFASQTALRSLVREGRVTLYARLGEDFWQSDSQGRFIETTAPMQYYQMQYTTVPTAIRNALAAVAGDSVPEWGVSLPASTEGQIQALTADRSGGQLVIGDQGQVEIE